jgi:hypothetical protein
MLPSVASSHSCEVGSLVVIEYDTTATQAQRPSGDNVAALKRFIAHRSSIVIDRFFFVMVWPAFRKRAV